MASISTSIFPLLLFYSLFFLLVNGSVPINSPPNSETPALAPSNTPPNSGSNSSAPPAPPVECRCPLKPQIIVACTRMLSGSLTWIPRRMCCEGLKGLNYTDVYSCICHVFPGIRKPPSFTVTAAMMIVQQTCRF